MVLAWRDPVEGLFEVRGKDGECLRLLNLLDDLEYRTYANAGRSAFRSVTEGGFLGARLVALPTAPGAWSCGSPDSPGASTATPCCADTNPGTTRPSRALESP